MDPTGWTWSTTEELLAGLIEVVDAGNRMFYSAHTKKGSRALEPIRIDRPWQRDEEPKKIEKPTHSEIVRFFGDKAKVS